MFILKRMKILHDTNRFYKYIRKVYKHNGTKNIRIERDNNFLIFHIRFDTDAKMHSNLINYIKECDKPYKELCDKGGRVIGGSPTLVRYFDYYKEYKYKMPNKIYKDIKMISKRYDKKVHESTRKYYIRLYDKIQYKVNKLFNSHHDNFVTYALSITSTINGCKIIIRTAKI